MYYSYDNAGQLMLEHEYFIDESVLKVDTRVLNRYEHDASGNRTYKFQNDDNVYREKTTYTYDANNRLTSSFTVHGDDKKPLRSASYYYDKNGNQTAKQVTAYSADNVQSGDMGISGRSTDTGLSIYRYDAFNRLAKYNSGSTEAAYTYNADNLRASKTVNRVRTDFVWNGQNLAAELMPEDMSANVYTYDPTGIHSSVINGVYSAYIKDTHGSVSGRVNNSGELMGEYTYDAFGNVFSDDVPDPFGYCGEYRDGENGLIYLRNRYYDSADGRFITEDPVKDGLNWYVYCSGNPVMLVDPSGLYYIVRDVSYTLDMDPRNKKFGRATGTYTVHSDTWGKFATRNLIGLAPNGAVINASLEIMTGVEGGNSANGIISAAKAVSTDALAKFGKRLFPTLTKAAKSASTVYGVVRECDTVYMDQIAFNLIDRNNISKTSTSYKKLENMMQKAYGFILENDKYFSVKYDGRGTLFEIDNKISHSKNPIQTINSLTNRYENNLIAARNNGAWISNNQIKSYVGEYRKMLYGYSDRIDLVNQSFSDYVK